MFRNRFLNARMFQAWYFDATGSDDAPPAASDRFYPPMHVYAGKLMNR